MINDTIEINYPELGYDLEAPKHLEIVEYIDMVGYHCPVFFRTHLYRLFQNTDPSIFWAELNGLWDMLQLNFQISEDNKKCVISTYLLGRREDVYTALFPEDYSTKEERYMFAHRLRALIMETWLHRPIGTRDLDWISKKI